MTAAMDRTPIFDLSRPAVVPCNGCTRCCYGAAPVRPEWGDNASDYQTGPATDPHTAAPVLILKRTATGACVYLGDDGCSIYDKRPAMCRSFDCRTFYRATRAVMDQMVGKAKTVRVWPALQTVLDEGKARMHTAVA